MRCPKPTGKLIIGANGVNGIIRERWQWRDHEQLVDRAPGVVSYFRGSCNQWKAGIPTATEIVYRQPWRAVDLHYRGQEGRLEAVYVVAPGADPATIRVHYEG